MEKTRATYNYNCWVNIQAPWLYVFIEPAPIGFKDTRQQKKQKKQKKLIYTEQKNVRVHRLYQL